MADVVLIARDPDLVDHLLALASAAELAVDVLADAQTVALVWTRAPLIVVGVDVLDAVVGAAPPRRPGVIVFGPARAEHWRMAFELGADRVVDPPGEPGWLAESVSGLGEQGESGRVVGVMGCRGGAGASVFASALAVAGTRQRLTPYLLDLDPLGCGLAVVLGEDVVDGLTWDQVRAGAGRIPARSLQSTIANVAGVGVLGWSDEAGHDLPAGVAAAVVDAARRCTPVTVLDVGRGVTDFQHEAMARCDRMLMIVPADVRSVRAARRTARRLGPATCEVIVRGPNPGGLTGRDVAEAVGLPVLAAVSADRGLDTRLERGEPPGLRRRSPLGRAGTGVLAEVLA